MKSVNTDADYNCLGGSNLLVANLDTSSSGNSMTAFTSYVWGDPASTPSWSLDSSVTDATTRSYSIAAVSTVMDARNYWCTRAYAGF